MNLVRSQGLAAALIKARMIKGLVRLFGPVHESGMTTSKRYREERQRGLRDAPEQIKLLQENWPKAFPAKPQEVRPLVSGIARIIAETLGWSPLYARAVVEKWKQRNAYCRAILAYPKRFTLDGQESEEEVDDTARSNAKQIMDKRAAKRLQEEAAKRAQAADEPVAHHERGLL